MAARLVDRQSGNLLSRLPGVCFSYSYWSITVFQGMVTTVITLLTMAVSFPPPLPHFLSQFFLLQPVSSSRQMTTLERSYKAQVAMEHSQQEDTPHLPPSSSNVASNSSHSMQVSTNRAFSRHSHLTSNVLTTPVAPHRSLPDILLLFVYFRRLTVHLRQLSNQNLGPQRHGSPLGRQPSPSGQRNQSSELK